MAKRREYNLIDTENVGDRWIAIADKLGKKDRMIVFYTQNHSKKLEEFLIKHVHDPRFAWIECRTGNDALDYQLVGVLSYLISKHSKAKFRIFSNDQGYQESIESWASRGINVSQMGFDISKKKKKEKKEKKQKQKDDSAKEKKMQESMRTDNPVALPASERDYVFELAKAIPMSELVGWHGALTALFGQKTGREWYMKVRDNAELKKELSGCCTGNAKTRSLHIILLFLNKNGLDTACAEDIYKSIKSHNKKNLQAIKQDMDKKLGASESLKYYKALRPVLKMIKGLSDK